MVAREHQHPGVVQRRLGEPGVGVGLERGLDLLAELGAEPREGRLLQLELARPLPARGIDPLQLGAQLVHGRVEPLAVARGRARLDQRRVVLTAPLEEERLGPLGPYELRQVLVELGVAVDPHRGVGELVDHGLGQLGLAALEHGREQRVVEPAERAVGRHRQAQRVEPRRLELVHRRARLVEVEVADVRQGPHDREPPGVRGERVGGGRAHVVGDRAPAGVVDLGVAAALFEPQPLLREAAHLEHQLELGPARRVALALEHLLDRLAAPHDPELRRPHVERVAARGGGADQAGERQGEARRPSSRVGAPHPIWMTCDSLSSTSSGGSPAPCGADASAGVGSPCGAGCSPRTGPLRYLCQA